ncbi:MAG: SGNH/GDSL hydrolase family protein, partial [Armatimonadetes bacterium]|nr:SGNH/GDSL hydrolase family protein [Armatimonadota bacterium]
MTRVVALGSSNTELAYHSEGRHNWFGWLEVGLRDRFGRVHHAINAGVSGETSRDMLGRFDRDVAHYRPHVVIITTGGNDCDPVHDLSRNEFEVNLRELVARCRALADCEVILQTYYAIDVA